MLNNYEELLQSRTICEGRCALGEQCPTGLCRSASAQKRTRRRSNSRSHSEMRRSPSTTSTSSNCSTSSGGRPRSGPAGLRSYTGTIILQLYTTSQLILNNLIPLLPVFKVGSHESVLRKCIASTLSCDIFTHNNPQVQMDTWTTSGSYLMMILALHIHRRQQN